jgi:hypothetical protein
LSGDGSVGVGDDQVGDDEKNRPAWTWDAVIVRKNRRRRSLIFVILAVMWGKPGKGYFSLIFERYATSTLCHINFTSIYICCVYRRVAFSI